MWLTRILERSQYLHKRIGTRWMQIGAITVHLIMGGIVGTAASLLAGAQPSPIATVLGTAAVQIALAYAWHRWFGPQINDACIKMLNEVHQNTLPKDAHTLIPVPDAWIAPLTTTVSLAITMDPSDRLTIPTIVSVGAATAVAEMLVKGDTIDRLRSGVAYWERETGKIRLSNLGNIATVNQNYVNDQVAPIRKKLTNLNKTVKRIEKMARKQSTPERSEDRALWTSSVVTVAVATLLIAGLASLSVALTLLADQTVTMPKRLLMGLLVTPPAALIVILLGIVVLTSLAIWHDYRKSRRKDDAGK